MQTALIIFARYDSTRLPGKVLMKLDGRELLGRVLDRTRCVTGKYQIIVATSTRTVDDPIVQFAKGENIGVFRGDLNDVAGRALACCKAYNVDRFARICADRPFLSWELINTLLVRQENDKVDLATNCKEKTYPSGMMTEIITYNALQYICTQTEDPADREHLTKYIYGHADCFRISNIVSNNSDWKNISLSLDTEYDKMRTEWMLKKMGDKPETLPFERVIALAQEWEKQN